MKRRSSPPVLAGADLSGRRLALFDFVEADLRNSNIRGASLVAAKLDRARLDGADLTGANLSGATLKGASLRNATLGSADLTDAWLDDADLVGVDLSEARLNGCTMGGALYDRARTGPSFSRAISERSQDVWPKLGAGRIHTIQIRFDGLSESPDWPIATILIDGLDVLGLERSIGFDPEDILGKSDPLLPTQPPRRVAVYRCNCGEPGCSCIAPLIVDHGAEVHWRDFRDFTGVYSGPMTDVNPNGGKEIAVPDLRFNATQYRAEIARATADRSWESHGRVVSRLLQDRLDEHGGHLKSLGYRRHWASPYRNGACTVSLLSIDGGHPNGQTIVELSAPDGDAEDVARVLADRLLMTSESDWRVTQRNSWQGQG